MRWSSSLAGLLLVSGVCFGQGTVVTPSALNGVEGSGLYIYGAANTFQQVIAPSQLGGLQVGAIITGMQLRLNDAFPSSDPSTNTNFEVSLGPSNFPPGSLSSSVAGNQGAGTTLVRAGSLNFAAGDFPTGGSPNGFGVLIPFTTSYVYTGGDLLITVSHTAPNGLLEFDVGGGITGVEVFQSQAFHATTLADDSPNTGLAIQFTFSAVPEPAVYYTAGVSGLMCGAVWWRRRKRKTVARQR